MTLRASSAAFLAGAASLPLDPPLGLPMIGFIRQAQGAAGYGELPLEASAVAFECDGLRAVVCGVDIIGIAAPEVDALIERVAEATGARPDAVLLNWSHTHLAPTGGQLHGALLGELDERSQAAVDEFAAAIQDTIVAVCALAAERLEPAAVIWGQGEVDLAVNRRERTDGETILGWNPGELVDNQVTTLQARRPDESVIATVVGYGCHPVTTGHDMFIYSADYPGALRSVVRGVTGGECVFLQGAAGNVLPRMSFLESEDEARRFGTVLALASLASVAEGYASPVELFTEPAASATRYTLYRVRPLDGAPPSLRAARETVQIPLTPPPSVDEIREILGESERDLAEARAGGDPGRIKVAFYHAEWARRLEAKVHAGTVPRSVPAQVNALRIGDGVIATGPGETFTEYGIAFKQRSPGRPSMYAGYTNGIVGYLPTAAEYPYGGYEAGFGIKSFGLPSLPDPSTERLLVETAVRLAEQLFPDAAPCPESRRLDGVRPTAGLGAGAPPASVAATAGGLVVKKARIGIIGAGFWASTHYLPLYSSHPDVEVVGVVRKDDDGLEEFKRTFGLEVATSSVDELLRHDLDAVVVSSPHSLHREHAVAALASGAHVLVEKPMTVHLADARAIQAAADLHGRVATVAHGWNYSRLATWAHEVIAGGELGRITSVTGYMASCLTELFSGARGMASRTSAASRSRPRAPRGRRRARAAGYLYGQLSHLLGLALWLLPNEPEETFARARLLDNGVDLDVQVSVEFGDGLIGSFSGHGHQPWVMRHACDLRIAGENGVLALDFERERAQVLLQGDREPRRGADIAARAPAGRRRGHVRVHGARAPPDRRLPRAGDARPGTGRRRGPLGRGHGERLALDRDRSAGRDLRARRAGEVMPR